ncbi:MAG TPA: FG-GAP-like repeat-containing protein [Pyrinomonadaceae bacterium]|nr:FG-GAP-like repeat-containing protein [Pyrinomonadaceae bacterium]
MQSVILADFNEDAKLDIVTGHSFADRIEISYGDGLGGFTVPFRMPVEDGVLGLAVGDFNRESRPDLFTTNLNVDNFSIFLANGIGGFLPRVNYAVGDIPDAPVVADFNSDGKPDVAMVNRGSETISVALNTCEGYRCTDPSFAPAQHFTVGGRLPSDLVAGDFNRDGKIDLATANSWSNSVSLLIGDGLGGFSAPTVINMNSNATFLVTGDFNKDGKLDIVTAGDWGVGVSILIGDGNGGFAPRQTYADGQTQRYSLISNDFNLDGNLDLALSDPNFIFVLFGNGNGGFSPSVKFPGGAADIDTADINADGRPDIVTEGYRVYLNTCIPNVAPVGVDDSFSTNVNAVLTVNASGVLANDTDLYNDPLTATLVSSTTHGTVVLNSNGSFTYTPNTGYSGSDSFTYRAGDGSFTSNIATVSLAVRTINAADDAVNVFENSGPNTLHVLANDFDLIGTPLITSITQTTKGTIAITNGGTDVTYTPNPNYFGADSFQYTITGGNGLTDTATVSISVNSPVGCGVVNFNQRTFYNVGEYPNSIAGGDLNRDGSLDLITANVYAGTVSVLFNTGTGGTFNPVQTFGRAEAGLTTQQAIASDLNSDGFMDMVAVNESIDHVSVFLGTQSGVYAYIEAYVGPSPTQVVVADFNSDGKLDLAATNHNTHTVSIMLGYGSGAFMQPQQFPVSFFPFTIGSADFNNDGKPDVATGNSDGTVSILLGNGTGGFAEAQSFGSNGNIRSVDFADFNRDGNLDIVTASRNSYRVEILVGDGNGGFELYKTFSDVEHTNSIAAGDFNGDRRADIAIASQSGSRPLQLLFGDSEGGFKRESFEQLTYLWNIAAIDINSDGYPDLVGTQVDGASYFVTSINSCAAISRFESDVAGRPWGDGIIQSDDVSLIRRFLSRAYSPNVPEGEFRRADSAPNNTGGDGLIDARDVVQARRYATGTDPIRAAAGPADATPTSGLTEGGKDQKHANPEGAVRQLEVLSGQGGRNAHVTLNVLVDAASDESEYAFAINYDPAVLLNPIAGTGNAGALAQNCSVYPIGRLNCSVGEFPNNNPSSDTASIGEIPAGSDQILMTVTFQIAVTAPTGLTPVTFSNAEAANDAASGLLVSGIDGNVDVLAPTAANVSVSGRVLTATGRGLNGVVTMTDMNGNERSTRTNTFGYFTFYNVTAGEAYVVNVRSKGYSFVPQIISVTDNVTELILTLLP